MVRPEAQKNDAVVQVLYISNMPYTESGVPTKKPHPKAFLFFTAEPASSLVKTTKSHTDVSK